MHSVVLQKGSYPGCFGMVKMMFVHHEKMIKEMVTLTIDTESLRFCFSSWVYQVPVQSFSLKTNINDSFMY